MRWLYLVVLALLVPPIVPFLAPPHAFAVQPDEILADPALEVRARVLSKELRCMVCQNQSIDDSDAPLARDLRVLVRERLQAGDSDRQVIDFLVARYGEFVLLKPRFSSHTALLWLGPAGILLIGAFGLFVVARRYHLRTSSSAVTSERPELTPGEAARLAEILRRRDG
jgi:cytochrome c-type biogenesis protein CcmH